MAPAPDLKLNVQPAPAVPTRPKLRVLQVVEATFAGVGRHVVDLAGGLLARGHDVHLVYSSLRLESRFRASIEELENLRKVRLDMARQPAPADGRAVLALRRYVRMRGPFDIVHGHSSKGGAIARLATAGARVRRIYTPHALRTLDPSLSAGERLLYDAVERVLGRYLTDVLIAVAREEADEARRLGIRPERTHVVPNGIALPDLPERGAVRARLGLDAQSVCILWVGRLTPQKAPDRFVRLFARLAEETPEAVSVMIGDGPMHAEVEALIRWLGLHDRLRLMRDEHAVRIMPAADIFALTSRYEGMPYVLIEAQCLGLPVVAFDVGGLRTAIEPGATGFACAQDDEASFIQTLRRLVGDTELRQTLARIATRRAGLFRLDRMVDRIEALYRNRLDELQNDAPDLAA